MTSSISFLNPSIALSDLLQPSVSLLKPWWCNGGEYWRDKARGEYYNKLYRKRSVGEGLFDALSNWFGDRVKTMLRETTLTRIGARIVVYQMRIYMRIENIITLNIEIIYITAIIRVKIEKIFLEHSLII